MGIDVDQLEQERAKMEARRKELERLQRQNEEELSAIKAKVNSRGNSRRSSISAVTANIANKGLPASALQPKSTGVGAKLASEAFLGEMYERAVDAATLQQLKETRQALDKLLEEKNFTQKIIEQLRNDNKQMKKDFDLLTKIIEQYRGEFELMY